MTMRNQEEEGDLHPFLWSLLTSLSRGLIRNPVLSCRTELEVDLALKRGTMKTKHPRENKVYATWG